MAPGLEGSLLLDDGVIQLLFIVVDNQGFDSYLSDFARQEIQNQTGIPMKNIVISATHTHSGINARGKTWTNRETWDEGWKLDSYQTFLVRRIVESSKEALHNLQPALIGWGAGSVTQHVFNRRWKVKETIVSPFEVKENVKMNPSYGDPNLLEPAGPTDPEVSFISVKTVSGQPIALFANYSLHYAAGVPSDHVSADYFGVFAERMKALLEEEEQDVPFVGIMSNGTSGDINSNNYGMPVVQYEPYEKMATIAEDVAQEVYRVYEKIKYRNWVSLGVAESQIRVAVRKPTPKELKHVRFLLERSKTEPTYLYHYLEASLARHVIRLHEVYPDTLNIKLQAFRIGDLAIATIPFEVFAETGLEIKERSPFKSTFTIGLANGTYIYLPTETQHGLGGYETWMGLSNRVEKNAASKIQAEVLSLFSQL